MRLISCNLQCAVVEAHGREHTIHPPTDHYFCVDCWCSTAAVRKFDNSTLYLTSEPRTRPEKKSLGAKAMLWRGYRLSIESIKGGRNNALWIYDSWRSCFDHGSYQEILAPTGYGWSFAEGETAYILSSSGPTAPQLQNLRDHLERNNKLHTRYRAWFGANDLTLFLTKE